MGNELSIAYIYMCHNNPDLLARVARVLEYKSDSIFVHVDNKVDITPFIESCSGLYNVHFNQDRIDNYWGGYNSVVATIETMRMAMNSGNYSRFVLLQGQDYPLVSPKKIHDFFENNDIEYCLAKDITISKDKKDYMKWGGYWGRDSKSFLTKVFMGIVSRFNKLGIPYRRGIFMNNGEKWHVYKGWAQFSLTKECVSYIMKVYDNNAAYNNFMKHRFPPDEIYFHTIIHNSKFKDKVSTMTITNRNGNKTLLNLTYFEYPRAVTVFTNKKDYEWLRDFGCLFVRKVNEKSTELLDEIDRNIK